MVLSQYNELKGYLREQMGQKDYLELVTKDEKNIKQLLEKDLNKLRVELMDLQSTYDKLLKENQKLKSSFSQSQTLLNSVQEENFKLTKENKLVKQQIQVIESENLKHAEELRHQISNLQDDKLLMEKTNRE